jgi:hypothetical protein
MSLAELAILLNTINEHSIHNDLYTYQCYWYAYTVWEILRTQFRGDVMESEMQDKGRIYMGVNIRREDSMERIVHEYRCTWKSFCEAGTRTRQEEEEAIIREVNFQSHGGMEYSLTIIRLRREGKLERERDANTSFESLKGRGQGARMSSGSSMLTRRDMVHSTVSIFHLSIVWCSC